MGGRKPRDLKDQTFGHLFVIERATGTDRRQRYWRCSCTRCGRTDVIRTTGNLRLAVACGCTRRKETPEPVIQS